MVEVTCLVNSADFAAVPFSCLRMSDRFPVDRNCCSDYGSGGTIGQ
jgi:hypothetical protein